MQTKLKKIDWGKAGRDLHEQGYTIVENVLTGMECEDLIQSYHSEKLFRKTITMERYRFGLGEYKYYHYPLPDLITDIRQTVYPYLAPIANHWMSVLGIDRQFPADHQTFRKQCHDKGQVHPTILLLKYGQGGFNTLHQDLYGDIYFPMQLVLFLNQPEEDYTGGEFVLTEQIPRAQSKAKVLQPKRGDMLIFTTSFRPVKGSKGYYRVNMKHGVSPLHFGSRHTLGIIFHDALS
ncbi:2OG-Fe(II) oxygenase [Flavitalea flava]